MVVATPNTALHRTPAAAPLSPVSFGTFGDLTRGIVLTGLAITLASRNVASQPAVQQIKVHVESSWQGLVIEMIGPSSGNVGLGRPTPVPNPREYEIVCDPTECPEPVALLLRCLAGPAKAEFTVDDLADVVSWIQTATPQDIRKENSGAHHSLYSVYASPRVREAFETARSDRVLITRLLTDYYAPGHWWTDDDPHVSATVILADGKTVRLSSSAQQLFMIPWNVTRSGSTYRTYEPNIGRALALLARPGFTQGARLAGTGLKSWLIGQLFQVALRKEGPRP
jgi:hypothetical protein